MATKKVLVEINVEQKGNSIPKTTKEVDKLARATERLGEAIENEGSELEKVKHQHKQQIALNKKVAKSQIDTANAIENTSDKMQKFKTTSGLTGAIVTEFGRTASDSAYGIRGMGNNISQIVTLFGQLQVNVAKAGGTMKDAFSQVFQSMKGVIGVMTALQIVLGVLQAEWFQKWASGLLKTIGLMDLFKGQLDGVRKGLEEVSSGFGEMTSNLQVYTDILNSSTDSIKEKEKAYKSLIDEFPEMESSIKRVGDEFIISSGAVDTMKKSLEDYALSAAALKRLNEIEEGKLKNIINQRLKLDEINKSSVDSLKVLSESYGISEKDNNSIKKYDSVIKDLNSTETERLQALTSILKLTEKIKKNSEGDTYWTDKGIGEAISDYTMSLKDSRKGTDEASLSIREKNKESEKEVELIKEYIKLEDKTKPKGNTKDPLERKVSSFAENRLSLDSELQRSQDELLKTTSRTNLEIIEDEGNSSKDIIKIKTDEFKKREELRLKNFIAQKNIDRERKGITQAEKDKINKAIEEAEETSEKTIKLADEEATKVIESITKVTDARILNRQRLDEVNQRKRDDSVEEGGLDLIANIMSEGMQKILAEEELAQLRYDNKVARANEDLALDTLTEDQRRDLETQKSLWFQQKSEEDLDFDISMIEERFRIQQEYIGFISQTSGVLRAIGNKNKEWQKTQLIIEKGAAIAGVVTQAAKSIAAQTASQGAATGLETATAASLNAVSFGTAGTAYLATKKSAISAETAKGIAKTKVSAGLSIAAITAGAVSGLNSISNSGGGSSGGGGGSATVQPPDFNIVGSTGVNQLADAIGSTETPIVKAVVVASEVTSQQALDRNTRTSAEL